jgi:hypothetical protein
MVKACSLDMNGLHIKVYLNIKPLGSKDCIFGMDWLMSTMLSNIVTINHSLVYMRKES